MLNAFMGMSNSRIDNMGHLGGFLGGIACAYLFGPRLLPITDNYGRTYMANVPILREWWVRSVRGLQKVGIVPKSKRPTPTPQPKRKPSLLQRLKSALNLPSNDKGRQRRPPGASRWGTAMVGTPCFQGARPAARGMASGRPFSVYRGMRLHGSALMPRHVLAF